MACERGLAKVEYILMSVCTKLKYETYTESVRFKIPLLVLAFERGLEKVLPYFRTTPVVRKWETCTAPVRRKTPLLEQNLPQARPVGDFDFESYFITL